MCEKCMSLKPDKTPGMQLKVRCPLCVEEDITVPAAEIEFTDNGVKSKKIGVSKGDEKDSSKKGKAAESVLKWGGGHAKEKKEKRRMKRKMKQTPCQFGKECHRKDCLFDHPDREKSFT